VTLIGCSGRTVCCAQPVTLLQAANCTNTDAEAVNEGRLSYPSGHASNTLSVSWFCALYVVGAWLP